MTRSRDPLVLSPHWHLDCRIEAELPEDNVVGTRFLINALFGSVAFAAVLFAGWLAYMNINLQYQIRDWDQRIADSRSEVREVQRMQHDLLVEAKKVDNAYALMKSQPYVSGFLANLGRTLPPQMNISSIESNDTAAVVRGNIRESYEAASSLFSGYLKQLGTEPEIGPNFEKITSSDFKRTNDNGIIFEITLIRKPPPP
jgi:hypothetical protein